MFSLSSLWRKKSFLPLQYNSIFFEQIPELSLCLVIGLVSSSLLAVDHGKRDAEHLGKFILADKEFLSEFLNRFSVIHILLPHSKKSKSTFLMGMTLETLTPKS